MSVRGKGIKGLPNKISSVIIFYSKYNNGLGLKTIVAKGEIFNFKKTFFIYFSKSSAAEDSKSVYLCLV